MLFYPNSHPMERITVQDTLEQTTLTSEDIRGLRKSSSVSFHAKWDDYGTLVESYMRGRARDVAGEDYTVAMVNVGSTFSYGGAIVRENKTVRAYESCLSAQFHEHWTTFVGLLRAGDRLTLTWSANGHRNEIVKRAGLSVDSLDIRVDRGKRRMTFHIDQRVSEYNSARMFGLGDTFNPVVSDRDRDLTL